MPNEQASRKYPIRDPKTGKIIEVTRNEALAEFKKTWCKECDIFHLLQPGASLETVEPLCTSALIDSCPTYKKIQAFKQILTDQADERQHGPTAEYQEILPTSPTSMYLLKYSPITVIAVHYLDENKDVLSECADYTINNRAIATQYSPCSFILISYKYRKEEI